MCSDMTSYSGHGNGGISHCQFRNKVSFLNTSAHTAPPPWRKKESFPEGSFCSEGGYSRMAHSDVQMCLSMIVPWIAMHTGFHFPLPLWSQVRSRWNGGSSNTDRPTDWTIRYWTIHRFNMSAPTTTKVGENESPCAWLSTALS